MIVPKITLIFLAQAEEISRLSSKRKAIRLLRLLPLSLLAPDGSTAASALKAAVGVDAYIHDSYAGKWADCKEACHLLEGTLFTPMGYGKAPLTLKPPHILFHHLEAFFLAHQMLIRATMERRYWTWLEKN